MTDTDLSAHLIDRLRPHRGLPDGLVEHRQGRFGQIVVAKEGNELFLVFCPSGVPLSNQALSGVMSRIDLTNPLTLTGVYTQAMLACLAFVPDPRQVYMMGGGGGRVPTVLHALLPDVTISGSEIDRDVLDLSCQYFGLEDTARISISCAEGKRDLSFYNNDFFDHLYLDCFAANGRVPPELTTKSFFDMCRSKLKPGGVISMNFVDSDPKFAGQKKRFARVFDDVRSFQFKGTHVMFGRKAAQTDSDDLIEIARSLQDKLPFGFDLVNHVRQLHPI
ncbi:MAG: fused MFS/spermidine synthase [Pseudomonadota bacterium]